jgi:tetratricopeptide (TPR) repeat protein
MPIRILCLLVLIVLSVHVSVHATKAFPGHKLKTLYKEGIICRNAGHFDKACKYFNEILQEDSSYAAAYLQLAQIYALEEHFQKSILYYRHFLQREDKQVASWYTVGTLYFNTKDFAAAVNAFEQAMINGYLQDADFHLNLGIAYLHIRQTDEGIRQLQYCQQLCTEDTRPIQALAHHYYLTGDYHAAISYWTKLVVMQPSNAFALFMLGKSYIGNGDIAKGEALCDKAITNYE